MKIGDYVRTKRGLIAKIINISTFREPYMKYGIWASYLDDIWYIGDDDIKLVKKSPIDLIEVGDYVNGLRVNEISEHTIYLDDMRDFSKKDINYVETIVTKEQFESMEYKIGE